MARCYECNVTGVRLTGVKVGPFSVKFCDRCLAKWRKQKKQANSR